MISRQWSYWRGYTLVTNQTRKRRVCMVNYNGREPDFEAIAGFYVHAVFILIFK